LERCIGYLDTEKNVASDEARKVSGKKEKAAKDMIKKLK